MGGLMYVCNALRGRRGDKQMDRLPGAGAGGGGAAMELPIAAG